MPRTFSAISGEPLKWEQSNLNNTEFGPGYYIQREMPSRMSETAASPSPNGSVKRRSEARPSRGRKVRKQISEGGIAAQSKQLIRMNALAERSELIVQDAESYQALLDRLDRAEVVAATRPTSWSEQSTTEPFGNPLGRAYSQNRGSHRRHRRPRVQGGGASGWRTLIRPVRLALFDANGLTGTFSNEDVPTPVVMWSRETLLSGFREG